MDSELDSSLGISVGGLELHLIFTLAGRQGKDWDLPF